MKIKEIYRISSSKKLIGIDDVSISPEKVANKIIIFDKDIPENTSSIFANFPDSTYGLVIVADKFEKNNLEIFDNITINNNQLVVVDIKKIDKQDTFVCIPECYSSFYTDQTIEFSQKTIQAKILSINENAHREIEEDKGSAKAVEMLSEYFKNFHKRTNIEHTIIPNRKNEIEFQIEQAKHDRIDILITTGGTGIGFRDMTPDVVKCYLTKEMPGIMETIRAKYGMENPIAMLNTGIAGIMDNTLVFTLPASEKAVQEYMTEILKCIKYIFFMRHGIELY